MFLPPVRPVAPVQVPAKRAAAPVFPVRQLFFVWKETKKNTTDVISLYSFFGVPGLKTIPYRYACGLHAGTGTDVCGTCDGHSGFFTGDRFL